MTEQPERKIFWVWLSEMLGPCSNKLRGLLTRFGTPEMVYERRETAEMALLLSPKEYRRARTLLLDDVRHILKYCFENRVAVIGYSDGAYPERLRASMIPPAALYVTGDPSALKNVSIAGVGSRYSTQYGRDAVRFICEPLAAAGVTLVSGMAVGIDTDVHQAALHANGATVAVLGTGIDLTYPARHREFRRVIEQNGAVVSEYPPFSKTAPYMFPLRNRIISGLAKAVVIFEAAKRSGTMITAGWALDDGRDVFAVPGNILSPQSEGTNRLIAEGAIPALSASDILEAIGLPRISAPADAPAGKKAPPKLSGLDKIIYDILRGGERSLDEIASESGRPSGPILAALTMLELDGVAESVPGQRYRLL